MLGLVVAHLVLACLLPLVSARSRRAGFAVAAVPPAAPGYPVHRDPPAGNRSRAPVTTLHPIGARAPATGRRDRAPT